MPRPVVGLRQAAVDLRVKLFHAIRLMGFDFAEAVKMTDRVVQSCPSAFR